ncbi:MAG: hypothetical protein IRY94_17345, partial [Rhodospirillaceae bacterium]|nr:hypothetical protein [Rhodospirillaceae bacterium]
FYRRFVGTGLSENAGFILGCLAAALLWRGAGTRAPRELYGGAFLLTLALVARAGCFFVLPFLVLWIARLLRKEGWISLRAGLLGIVAVGAGFLCNFALLRLFGQPESAFSNFPVVLYGLISGGNWTTAYAEHPEIRTLPESEAARRVLGFALAKLREDPWLLAKGVMRAWEAFFSLGLGHFTFLRLGGAEVREITRALSPWSDLWPPALARIASNHGIRGWPSVVYHAVYTLLPWVLFLAGAISVTRRPGDARSQLLGASWVGIVLSIPFVPPWDGDAMRVYAATMPVQLVLPAVGASRLIGWLRTRLARPRIERGSAGPAMPTDPTAARTVGLAAVSALLPALVALKVGMPAAAPPPAPDLACARGEPHLVVPIRGTQIALRNKRAGLLQPTFQDFQSGLAPVLGLYPDLLGPLADLAPGTVLTAVRYVDKRAYGVLARPAGPAPAAPIGVCVEGRPLLIRMEDRSPPTP